MHSNDITLLQLTEAETNNDILIQLNSINAIAEDKFDNASASSVFINGNRFLVKETFAEIKSMIEKIIRGY